MDPYILKNLIEGGVGFLAGTAAGYIDSKTDVKLSGVKNFLRSVGIVLSFDGIQSVWADTFHNTGFGGPFSDAVQGDVGGVAGIYSGLYLGKFLGDGGIKSSGKSLKQYLQKVYEENL